MEYCETWPDMRMRFSSFPPDLPGYKNNIMETLTRQRIPSMAEGSEFVVAGGVISYGADYIAIWKRAAVQVSKILKGAKPADLPVEQPTKFEFVINLKPPSRSA